jgi:hypothetical protein
MKPCPKPAGAAGRRMPRGQRISPVRPDHTSRPGRSLRQKHTGLQYSLVWTRSPLGEKGGQAASRQVRRGQCGGMHAHVPRRARPGGHHKKAEYLTCRTPAPRRTPPLPHVPRRSRPAARLPPGRPATSRLARSEACPISAAMVKAEAALLLRRRGAGGW